VLVTTGTLINPFQYTGRDNDSETGLRYYRARYYDPSAGRFLTEDPTAFRAGMNFYSYVENSPIVFSDPTGQFPTWWHSQITFNLAQAVFGGKCLDKARAVAAADASVDDLGGIWGAIQFITHNGPGWAQPGPHFPNGDMLEQLHNTAMKTCSAEALGQFLHSDQDAWAHSGWSSFDHYTHGGTPDRNAVNDAATEDRAMLDTVRYLQEFKAKCVKCCE
jgi:RHS repeat-associated protein